MTQPLRQYLRHHMRVFGRARRGGVVMLTALVMPFVLIVCALAVDLGILYIAKSRVETAALHAAESGLNRLPDTLAAEDLAEHMARAYFSENGLAETVTVSSIADASGISVSVSVTIKAIFGQFAGTRLMTASTEIRRDL